MIPRSRTSAEALADHVPGKLLASSSQGRPWEGVLVQVFSRPRDQESYIVPAVLEPLIVWVLSGAAIVEERELDGAWTASRVKAGDLFLTSSATPYEMRWRATSSEPNESLHVYLGLPLLERAVREVLGPGKVRPRLRELSGHTDPVISVLLERLRAEVMGNRRPSPLSVQGLGQCLAVHLVRHYRDERAPEVFPQGGLPAFKLHKVISLLEANLAKGFKLAPLARAAGLSEFHFSRLFKRATGYSPSHYILDIGLEVGYGGASHFAAAFRREMGLTPTAYRH